MRTKKYKYYGGQKKQTATSALHNTGTSTWVKGNNRTGANVVKGIKKKVAASKQDSRIITKKKKI